MTILVTGGAGFIGSNFVVDWLSRTSELLVNVDALTYASHEQSNLLDTNPTYQFHHCRIGEKTLIDKLLVDVKPRAIINFAAESHVDNSILDPAPFIKSNVLELSQLLASTLEFCKKGYGEPTFYHISTDEVFGSLSKGESAFTETSQIKPSSPYAASKAASDHLVNAFHKTYGLNTLISNCSNNYGPYQHFEKLIPKTIANALQNKPIPIYGNGQQIRDWLFVEDHVDAINLVLSKGTIGQTYNVGGRHEVSNIELVVCICEILDELRPRDKGSYVELIAHVEDRLGHDTRYAVNITKINQQLGWLPKTKFQMGLRKTIDWYLEQIN